MPEGLTIEKMREGEEQEIANLIKQVFGEFVAPAYGPEGVNHFLDYIEPANISKRRSEGNHLALTAKIDEQVVGIIEIRDWNHICLLFVDKKYHNNGIAQRLFRESVRHCREKGTAELDVNSSLFAVPIYERLGFVQTESEQTKNGIIFVPMKLNLLIIEIDDICTIVK